VDNLCKSAYTVTMTRVVTKSGPVTIRLSPDVLAALREIAAREDRSLSYVMNRTLRRALEAAREIPKQESAKSNA
jgi:predicted transcriptional regulator